MLPASFSKNKVLLFHLTGYDQAILEMINSILIYDGSRENYSLQHISGLGLEISNL